MCYIPKESSVAKEDITAYKVVKQGLGGKFHSQWEPSHRSELTHYCNYTDKLKGERLDYVIGRELVSKAPGIFAYKDYDEADQDCAWMREVVLEILIPAGTIIREGFGSIITAERIIVVKKIPHLLPLCE